MAQTGVSAAQPGESSRNLQDFDSLLQSQKMELVGQLAATMANEFNNIMMALTGCAELELKRTAPDRNRNLEQIICHSTRATTLIQKLLAFSRKHSPAPSEVPMNQVVEDIGNLLQTIAGEEIEVRLTLGSNVGAILADPIEVEQLILGLGLYMRDAMSVRGGLEVTTELVDLDDQTFRSKVCQPGRYVVLSMRYIPAAARNRLHGEGSRGTQNHEASLMPTIAAVHRIVEDLHGHLHVSSRPSQSSAFRIYFPAIALRSGLLQSEVPASNAVPSRKTVLIVEDDDAVRGPAVEFLMMEGFKVLQARNGMEALRIVQESRSHLDLLVTDIVMAGMNGNEVADRLVTDHPGLRILYMSGDADKVSRLAGASDNMRKTVLQKPFRLQNLSGKIQELLSE